MPAGNAGEQLKVAPVDGDAGDLGPSTRGAGEVDPLAIAGPGGLRFLPGVRGDLHRVGPVGVHDVEIEAAGRVGTERNPGPFGRKDRMQAGGAVAPDGSKLVA